jgi:hypothetical protein
MYLIPIRTTHESGTWHVSDVLATTSVELVVGQRLFINEKIIVEPGIDLVLVGNRRMEQDNAMPQVDGE